MIAAAYLVLTICSADCIGYGQPEAITSQTVPQPSLDQCIRQANAFNTNRKDVRAMCVRGAGK